MLALGMTLPGLKHRAAAVAQLPALGLLTLAGLTPPHWTCSYHEAARADETLTEEVLQQRPTLVALSALTASVEEAIYSYSDQPLCGTDLVRTVRALQQLPEGPVIAAVYASSVESELRNLEGLPPSDGRYGRTTEEREALKALVQLAKKSTRPKQ